jgi:DNA-binding SARP family transcriptional activator/ActR/RegA family two-component response regulator
MRLLTVRLFGEFATSDHLGNPLSVGNKRTQALLTYLALRIDTGGTRAEAAELLLGSSETRHMTDLIEDLRYALRFLPREIFVTEGDLLRLNPSAVTVDAQRFEMLAAKASLDSTREAADLYRGNLLDGYVSGSAALDEWIADRRLHYWRFALGVLGRLLAAQMRAGWWQSAVDTASKLLSLDPTQEVVHRTLIRLQLEQGRPDSALRRYHECADILQREFGALPSPETERLHEQILTMLERAPAPREAFRDPIHGPVLVLLVEDDAVTSALIEGFLTEAGYEVVAVADGADALIEIGRRQYDLLILDVNVPTLSGLRLFEIMIQKEIDTPAIFITGVAGAEAEVRSLEMGAADFLRKPIRREVLLPRIRSVLQHKQRARAIE